MKETAYGYIKSILLIVVNDDPQMYI